MPNYQRIEVIGHVGRDPDLRYLQNGTAVCDFSVAYTDKWTAQDGTKRESTTWFKVTAWRALAENCNKYVTKGMAVMVVGKIAASAYMSQQDNEPKASLELTANDVVFLSRSENEANQNSEDDLPF